MTAVPTLPTARRLLPPADGRRNTVYQKGTTRNIIAEVETACRRYPGETVALAQELKSPQAIWQFIRQQVRYIADGYQAQDIKRPSRLLADGYGDCKSYSVLSSCLLHNLGIKHSLRFVSYDSDPQATHVYVVFGDKDTPLDACYYAFGAEKPFTYKYDILMTKISHLTGVGSLADALEGDLEIALAKERAELEKRIGVSGIGRVLNTAKAAKKNEAGLKVAPAAKTSKQKEVADALVKEGIPKASLFFLYLFVQDPDVIAKLPAKSARQRKVALTLAKFLTRRVGMSDTIFMSLVRNAIMKKTGKTPEQIISASMSGVTGIGFLAAILPLAGEALKIIKVIVSKVKEAFPKTDPDDEDAPADSTLDAPDLVDLKKTEPGTLKKFVEKVKQVLKKDEPGTPSTSTTPGAPGPLNLPGGGMPDPNANPDPEKKSLLSPATIGIGLAVALGLAAASMGGGGRSRTRRK